MNIESNYANDLWLKLLDVLLKQGQVVNPRGMATKEIIPVHLALTDSLNNLITVAARKLNYPFMVAEWFWIMAGQNDVETISFYNKQIGQFSDDGSIFYGAYGTKVRPQLEYVLSTLRRDPASRQAVLTIWREIPPATKDVPCTVSMQFLVRNGKVHCIVNMRSSDAWLGLPYDIFNFTRIQAWVAAALEMDPGEYHMTLGSSHLYQRNWEQARTIVNDYSLYHGEGRSPKLTHAITSDNFHDIEKQARLNGYITTRCGRVYEDYAEALFARHPDQEIVGTGHMVELIREMLREQQYIEEGDDHGSE